MSMINFMLRAQLLTRDPEAVVDRLCAAWRRQEPAGTEALPDDTLRAIMRVARNELKRRPEPGAITANDVERLFRASP
jgi:hypothetical protein